MRHEYCISTSSRVVVNIHLKEQKMSSKKQNKSVVERKQRRNKLYNVIEICVSYVYVNLYTRFFITELYFYTYYVNLYTCFIITELYFYTCFECLYMFWWRVRMFYHNRAIFLHIKKFLCKFIGLIRCNSGIPWFIPPLLTNQNREKHGSVV